MLPDAGGDGKPSARGLIASFVFPTEILSEEHARNDGENARTDEEVEGRLDIGVILSRCDDVGERV